MVIDIINELDSKDLNEFKKDFSELIRVSYGINKEYSKLGKDLDKYIPQFKKIVDLFNKKYKNLNVRLKQTTEELKLKVFIKGKSVRDVFTNVASKLDGLKAIGASDLGSTTLEETDKFSKELDKAKNKLFISYYEQEAGLGTVFLEQRRGMIELHYGEGIENEKSAEFKICAYYAVKDGIKKINIHERLSAMGFLEIPILERVRKLLNKFNPRIEE